jgi:hypothetical protein
MRQQNYSQDFDENGLAQTLETTFRNQGYQVQTLRNGNKSTYVQIKKDQGLGHKIVGLDRALTVNIEKDVSTNISLGQATWASKTAVGAFGLFVFFPLAVTGAYGLYEQNKLPGKVWNAIDVYAASKNTKPTEDKRVDETPCANCGVLNSSEAKFCNACGTGLPVAKEIKA